MYFIVSGIIKQHFSILLILNSIIVYNLKYFNFCKIPQKFSYFVIFCLRVTSSVQWRKSIRPDRESSIFAISCQIIMTEIPRISRECNFHILRHTVYYAQNSTLGEFFSMYILGLKFVHGGQPRQIKIPYHTTYQTLGDSKYQPFFAKTGW